MRTMWVRWVLADDHEASGLSDNSRRWICFNDIPPAFALTAKLQVAVDRIGIQLNAPLLLLSGAVLLQMGTTHLWV